MSVVLTPDISGDEGGIGDDRDVAVRLDEFFGEQGTAAARFDHDVLPSQTEAAARRAMAALRSWLKDR